VRSLALAIGFLIVAGPAAPAQTVTTSAVSASSTVPVRCGTSTVSLPVTWHFPVPNVSAGLVWLQHGFFRTNQNMADLGSKLARVGFVVVATTMPSLSACGFNNVTTFLPNVAPLFGTINAPGSPLLASARAAAAAAGVPLGALPERFVFSGHSAGGAAVTVVAKEYLAQYPAVASRLAGLVLLDPVESLAQSMQASLPALGALRITAITAPASACNAGSTGAAVLRTLGRPFIGIELTGGSHCDAEGLSGDALCGLVCGASSLQNVVVLQIFAIGWTADMLLDRTTATIYPGGPFFDLLVGAGLFTPY
jgi:hypothetical protein